MDYKIKISKTKNGTDKIECIDSSNQNVIGKLYVLENGMFRSFKVKPEYRRKEIGSAMLQELIKHFKQRKLFGYASPKFSDQNETNKEQKRQDLIRFYVRNGFTHTGKARIDYLDNKAV